MAEDSIASEKDYASKKQVETLYDNIAKWYDLRHHLQTLWADDTHRKEVIKYAAIKDNERVLDLGTGTALTAIMAYKSNPNSYIIGIDFSKNMLDRGEENLRKGSLEEKIKLIRGNMENMPFLDNTFDVIISAYGLGGVIDIQKVTGEIVRIAKPNTRVVLAEMTSPPSKYKIKKSLHKRAVEPWIYHFWKFRDIDLEKLFKENKISINYQEHFLHNFLGSTKLISGEINK